MKNNNKAFTLVELIVVITILAILGTIAFINLSGYSTNARDGKRVSDVNNIIKKVGIESSKGISLSTLITTTKTNTGLTINGNSGSSIQGIANFATLKEDGSKFKDPVTKGDYVLSYSVGGSGTGAYKFNQISTVNEETNTAVVKGNYYLMQTGDSPSITLTKVGTTDYYVVDGGVDLPYNVEKLVLNNEILCLELENEGNFTFDTGTQTILGYNNVLGLTDVEIPCKIGGLEVLNIGTEAFYYYDLIGTQLTNVTIPNSVISIGDSAFYGNQLVNLVIPNSVTSIGYEAFGGNQLTSLVISNSVTSIGNSVFLGNQLTSLVIPDSVTSIGDSAFGGNQLTSLVIPDSVTSIGDSAFSSNQLTSLVIPNSVTSIGYGSFSSNQLTSLDIPNSVTSIGTNAFNRNQLTNLVIPNSVTSIGNGAFNNNGPLKNSGNITGWISGLGGTWSLSGTIWIKQ